MCPGKGTKESLDTSLLLFLLVHCLLLHIKLFPSHFCSILPLLCLGQPGPSGFSLSFHSRVSSEHNVSAIDNIVRQVLSSGKYTNECSITGKLLTMLICLIST